jgi:hypothetical protein
MSFAMSPRNQRGAGRHFVHPHHSASGDPTTRVARRATLTSPDSFDVAAAFEPGFDFDQAFADLDAHEVGAVAEPVRPHRSRVAFAIAVTAIALPLLVVDNLGATAEPNDAPKTTREVVEAIEAIEDPLPSIDALRATVVVDTTVPVEITTTTVAPVTTVTEAPAPTTTAPKPVVTTAAPTTTAPRPTTTTTVERVLGDPASPATWDALAECESGGDWDLNTGNGYYGGLQFSQASWENVGGTGLPSDASKSTQIEMGKRLQARQGWAAWPTCARELGYLS